MIPKNECIRFGDAECEAASFGSDSRTLIILPGAADAFKTVKGMALPLSLAYRKFAKHYRVIFLSRRYRMPEGFTTADMADDLARIMDEKQIRSADIFGVSQGGMIAQQLALRHPGKTGKLVLAVTSAQMCEMTQQAIGQWLKLAAQADWPRIMQDTAERSYTERYLRKNAAMLKLVSRHTKPAEPGRAEIIFRSCLTHDVLGQLSQIKAPTLILGAGKDRIVGAEASKQMAERIPGSSLVMFDAYSHGVYDETPDFYNRVLSFLTEPERSTSNA